MSKTQGEQEYIVCVLHLLSGAAPLRVAIHYTTLPRSHFIANAQPHGCSMMEQRSPGQPRAAQVRLWSDLERSGPI